MNNKTSLFLTVYASLFFVSCNDDYSHNGCDAKTSNKVHEGWFSVDEIKAIGYIKSNSSDLYPMPSKKTIHESLKITELDFLNKFAAVVKLKSSKGTLDVNSAKAIHIFVLFKNGKIACLYSSVRSHGAYLSPMYAFDSYGYTNNDLHNLFNSQP